MTRDTHATGSSRQTGRRTARPDLGRPSLFADFDQDSVADVEPQRIRLLSTLESQRGVRGRPRGQRLATGRVHPWLTRALMVAMGLGMLVMLLSFIQLIRRTPPALPVQQTVSTTAAGARPAEPRAPAATPALTTGSVVANEAAEIIDMSPPSGGAASGPTQAAPPEAPAITAKASATRASASAGHPQAAPSSGQRTTETERANRESKQAAQRPTAKRDAGAPHDDVALVEAMLAHAGPRKPQPSPTAALQQCGTGSSPETAVCRARVCVQHPSLPACHTP